MTNLLCLIKIGSETVEISINITISNICVPPQILDNYNQLLKKQSNTLYFFFLATADVGFLLAISCW